MTILTREQFLERRTPPREEIRIPGEDNTVWVQGLTAGERDEYESAIIHMKGPKAELNRSNLRAKLIVRCVVDEKGARLLKDEDLLLVGKLPARVAEPIFEAAQRLSGLSPEDVETLAKNSVGGPVASPSSS